ncbi:GNAT family N-acetyltransferase [Gulosibacter molinativorax]|uniref:N-acetyltransferase n=1 Tax=Gulosibacter molinativorax TaxID=256821 RepID=A0ABT7C8M7_9MICO|nr:GNAT family N-acetyltransferase [Gulosibacter molinativorax]MDJ1371540.1 N-acetyltransferase [Gulosibacter molinativorax]QUY62482.1 MshD_3 protein [Gulosibacter molinativorax]
MTPIRPATSNDVLRLREIAEASFTPYLERMDTQPAPMLADYAALVDAGEVWVTERDACVAGFIVLQLRSDHVLLDIIAVAPDAQGRGLGAELMTYAETFARAQSASEIRLFTNEAMTENLVYYPRRGYVETHRAVEDGYSRVFFAKRL